MTIAFGSRSLVVVSAGVGEPCPTRLLADRIAEVVCRSLEVRGQIVELEVIELRRLATDLAQHVEQGHASLDLREAVEAVVAADGLVVATPVAVASPGDLFASFFDVLGNGGLSGMPVLVGVTCGSRWQLPEVRQVMRGRLARLHAELVSTVVVAGEDWEGSADSVEHLRGRIDQAAAELVAAMSSSPRLG